MPKKIKFAYPHLHISPKATIPAALKALQRQDVCPNASRLLAYIVLRSGTKGVMWWDYDTIAKDFGCAPDTIRHRATELIDAGLLSRITLQCQTSILQFLCPWPKRTDDVATYLTSQVCTPRSIELDPRVQTQEDDFPPNVKKIPMDRKKEIRLKRKKKIEQKEKEAGTLFRCIIGDNISHIKKKEMP